MTTIGPVERIGGEFAGYRIENLLGSGSYGSVYLAEELNPQLQRKVALKILRPDLAADPSFRERFFRESRLVARLEPHPAIVSVYNAGEDQGLLWIASRYVDGVDLRAVLEHRGPFAPQRVARLVDQLAQALDTAHRDGIVHRDVKPANILMSRDLENAYLADFGLSKRLSESVDNSLTHAGQFVGTVKYAAPEQLSGGEVSGRTDLYALGCVAFEMLTGRAPFEGGIDSVVSAHLQRPVPDVTAFAPEVPPAINDVIRMATAKRPDERYATCAEFAAAMMRSIQRGDSTVIPVPPPPPSPGGGGDGAASRDGGRPGGAKRGPALIGGALVLVLAVAAGVLWWAVWRTTPFPDAEEAALLEEVPTALRDSCARDADARGQEGVVAAVACEPSDAPTDEVTFQQAASPGSLERLFGEELGETAEEADDGAHCANSPNALSEYLVSGEPAGQVACYSEGGSAHLRWTAEAPLIVGAVRQEGADTEALYGWWEELLGVEPPFPDQEEAALLEQLPAALRDSCERDADASGADEVVASIACEPGDARADAVSLRQVDTSGDLERLFTDTLEETPVIADDETDCAAYTNAINEYSAADAHVGQVACYRDGGSSYLLWTVEELRVLGVAEQEGRSDLDLYDWWAELVGVEDPEPEEPPTEPMAPEDEETLRSHVPGTFEATCETAEDLLHAGQIAVVECIPEDAAASAVVYVLFDTVANMHAAYDAEIRFFGISPDTEGTCPSEVPWTAGDLTPGRLACAFTDEGEPTVIWTDDRVAILSVAFDFSGTSDPTALLDWWAEDEGGPIIR